MEVRRLSPGEREEWLELLDGWTLGDGWRGRDFFRRPLEADPGYDDADVWVAEEAGRLLSTVQIFPRTLEVAGRCVPTGGIGSVFTREERRGSGLAPRLLERAARDMRERGMALSLLFAARIPFYEKLGWRSWTVRRELLRRASPADAETDAAAAAASHGPAPLVFDASRDLEDVAVLHTLMRRRFSGIEPRDAARWRSSLALAGNPAEEFLVARAAAGGKLLAYLRAARLNEMLTILELGHRDADALAGLCAGLLTPRADDRLAPAAQGSARFRSFAVLPIAADAPLGEALLRRGLSRQPAHDPTVMLRCLDAAVLASQLGAEPAPGEPPEVLLRRALPPERFCHWPADRF